MLFYPKNIAFGLDIGDKAIKLAEASFIKNLRGEEFLVLTSYNEVFLPKDIILKGEIKNPPAVIEAIKKCVKTAKGKRLKSRATVVSLPESRCYLKLITLPDGNKASGAYMEELLEKHIPAESEEMYKDWQFINKNQFIMIAAPKNLVDSYINIVEQAGLVPLALELESTAISRALSDKTPGSKIIMDLGASRSTIIASYNGLPILSLDVPLSGDSITAEIAKKEKLDFEKAEEVKIKCGFNLEKCPASVKKTISAIISSATEKLKTGLQYISRYTKTKADKIYICGGVSKMSKITAILSEELHSKVRHADPLGNIKTDKKTPMPSEEALKYVTAIGLAMRGADHNVLKLNHNNNH